MCNKDLPKSNPASFLLQSEVENGHFCPNWSEKQAYVVVGTLCATEALEGAANQSHPWWGMLRHLLSCPYIKPDAEQSSKVERKKVDT